MLKTIVGTLIAQIGSRKIKGLGWTQENYRAKRENLTKAYESLILIVNLFPNEGPGDIIKNIKYGPYYSLENYNGVFHTLNNKIEDYEKQKSFSNLNYEKKNDIDVEISNIKYAKDKLDINYKAYQKAVKDLDHFNSSDKAIFKLYAGKHVQNCLVNFEVIINNVFIAGMLVSIPGSPFEDGIKIAREELINAMRNDIGTT
ncbi:hypothetical protein [Listeria welshimeri]|uniref:hypothetical protein n=1 Tax=Listeria welshimeri TaxID=1643 RepID=UPI001887BE4B|nr:hypothetical protein [Listeria welshimeri]MBF2593303.1 hypothetical protein [Listeria welshimeri]